MPRTSRFNPQRPSDEDVWEAATSGDWTACVTATEEDMLRPVFPGGVTGLPPTPAIYLAFEVKRLHRIPHHLRTDRVLNSLWELPGYAGSIMREFELAGELGDWGYLEPLLLTADNACRAVDARGQTCLHLAARHGHLHKTPQRMLTLRGLLMPDHTGITPMAIVRESDLANLVILLSSHIGHPERVLGSSSDRSANNN